MSSFFSEWSRKMQNALGQPPQVLKYLRDVKSNRSSFVPRPIPRMPTYSVLRRGGAYLSKRKPKVPANWLDISVNHALNTTGNVAAINILTKGDDYNTRDGREIKNYSMQLALQSQPTVTTGLAQSHRVLLVYDRFPQGVTAAFTDILKEVSIPTLINEDNRWRFRILYDSGPRKLCGQDQTNEVVPSNHVTYYRKYVNLHNIITRFNTGNAGTVADIDFGAILLVSMGDKSAGVTAGSLVGKIRFRFHP